MKVKAFDFTVKKIATTKFIKFSDLAKDTQEEFLEDEGLEAESFKFFRYDDLLFHLEELQVIDPDFRFCQPIFNKNSDCPTHWCKYQSPTGRDYYLFVCVTEKKLMVGKATISFFSVTRQKDNNLVP